MIITVSYMFKQMKVSDYALDLQFHNTTKPSLSQQNNRWHYLNYLTTRIIILSLEDFTFGCIIQPEAETLCCCDFCTRIDTQKHIHFIWYTRWFKWIDFLQSGNEFVIAVLQVTARIFATLKLQYFHKCIDIQVVQLGFLNEWIMGPMLTFQTFKNNNSLFYFMPSHSLDSLSFKIG